MRQSVRSVFARSGSGAPRTERACLANLVTTWARGTTCVRKNRGNSGRPMAAPVSDPVAEAMVLALLEEEDRRREEREYSRFAMLLNPMAMATLLPMYGIATIPVDVQIGWRYVGIGRAPHRHRGRAERVCREIGPRITPAGRGARRVLHGAPGRGRLSAGFHGRGRAGVLVGDRSLRPQSGSRMRMGVRGWRAPVRKPEPGVRGVNKEGLSCH